MNNLIKLTANGDAHIAENDPWVLRSEVDAAVPDGAYQIVSTTHWKQAWSNADPRIERGELGLFMQPDDDPALLAPWTDRLALIVLQFSSFRDGRAYSQATLLRTRYGFKGELRAVGDVLRDQLLLMRHCGFTSFAIREDKSATDAMKGLEDYDVIYARSVINPEPLFRRQDRLRVNN